MQAVRVGSGVDRMSENRQDSRRGGGTPLQVADSLTAKSAEAKPQAIHGEVAEHGVRRTQLRELVEDELDHGSRLLIGILNHLLGGLFEVPDRHGGE